MLRYYTFFILSNGACLLYSLLIKAEEGESKVNRIVENNFHRHNHLSVIFAWRVRLCALHFQE